MATSIRVLDPVNDSAAPLRILFWQEPFWPHVGGMQTAAEVLLRGLRDRGHALAVVTRQDSPHVARETCWERIAVHRRAFWRVLDSGSVADVAELRREVEELLRDRAPDVVHLSGLGPSALFLLESASVRRTPLLVTLHSNDTLASGRTTLVRQTLERADWVTACSHAMLDAARAHVPGISGRSSVIYTGVAAPALLPAPLPAEPAVLCLGQLAVHKGFDLVLHAFVSLRNRFPRARVVVAGDGPARGDLERLGDAVEFIGAVPPAAVPALMNAASLVVVPSRRETFGLVALEAAVMARPVVATRVGGLPEVVVDGETGLLVAAEDSAALAVAMGSLLADPTAGTRMGWAGRQRALRQFGCERYVDAYEDLYRRIAHGRAAPARGVATAAN
jgi:glycogen(starch) synthase